MRTHLGPTLVWWPGRVAAGKRCDPVAGKEPRLHNLDEDIRQRSGVAAKHPEVVARLLALSQRMNDEIGGTSPTARRPAGEVADPKPLYTMEEKQKRTARD